jgi:hypothetical protein
MDTHPAQARPAPRPAPAECPVCCAHYTPHQRRRVDCGHCGGEYCAACLQQYLLGHAGDAQCMVCRAGLDGEFLAMHLPKTWLLSRYKEHRENVLLERQKALLPASQDMVANYNAAEALRQRLRDINARRSALRRQQDELYTEERTASVQLDVIVRSDYTQGVGAQQAVAAEGGAAGRRQFVRGCPVDGCRGFLSTAWRCGTCETWVCKDCGEPRGGARDDAHMCDPEVAASHALLQRDTRPCPQCAAMIYKIDGCFGADTPVRLWDGSVKMSQDIVEGDVLIGDDGTPRTVIKTTAGEAELYRVDQTSGMSYVVNGKHNLLFKYSAEGVTRCGERFKSVWMDRDTYKFHTRLADSETDAKAHFKSLGLSDAISMTVDDYLKLPPSQYKNLMGWKCAGVEWTRRDVGLDPYLLGVWLGDGFSRGPGIAGNDPEVISFAADWCDANGAQLTHSGKYSFGIRGNNGQPALGQKPCDVCTGCRYKRFALCNVPRPQLPPVQTAVNPFTAALRQYNLINNKHIPVEYLVNDRDTRMRLLAGLVDTDGSVSNGGKRVVIRQTAASPVTSGAVVLARSLGLCVNVTVDVKKNVELTIGGVTLPPKDYKDQARINLSGTQLHEVPTLIPRKKCVAAAPNKDWLTTGFTVTPVGRGRYYGWMVDGPNNRFLLDDFTVVSNCDQVRHPTPRVLCALAFSPRSR